MTIDGYTIVRGVRLKAEVTRKVFQTYDDDDDDDAPYEARWIDCKNGFIVMTFPHSAFPEEKERPVGVFGEQLGELASGRDRNTDVTDVAADCNTSLVYDRLWNEAQMRLGVTLPPSGEVRLWFIPNDCPCCS